MNGINIKAINTKNPTSEKGFFLLEILISVLILSIGLLGLASMQVKSLQFSGGSHLRSQATLLAYDMVDRMRANIGNAYAAAYTDTGTNNACTSTCSTLAIKNKDIYEWKTTLASALPNGNGEIVAPTGSNNVYTITIRWNDSRGEAAGSQARTEAETQTFAYKAEI